MQKILPEHFNKFVKKYPEVWESQQPLLQVQRRLLVKVQKIIDFKLAPLIVTKRVDTKTGDTRSWKNAC